LQDYNKIAQELWFGRYLHCTVVCYSVLDINSSRGNAYTSDAPVAFSGIYLVVDAGW